jgi:hypothetical protein
MHSADEPAVSSAVFLGFVFCQTGLLGIWSGVGTSPLRWRLMGLVAGAAYLARLLGRGIDETGVETTVLAVVPSLLVALATSMVRLFRGTIQRLGDDWHGKTEALQFGIRHLMMLTFVVALLTMGGKQLASTVSGIDSITRIVVLALSFSAVNLASIWAMLGSGRPLTRSGFVVLTAALAGIVGGYVIDGTGSPSFWLSSAVLQSLLLIGSLQVIRRAGYRFVAKHPTWRPP